jgi:hypothetical protein
MSAYQCQQNVAGLHSGGDDLGEVIARHDRVDMLEDLVPAELTGKPVE